MSKETPQITSSNMKPGDKMVLSNQGREAVSYTLEFGEYGTLQLDGIIGSEITLEVGTKSPKIIINDSNKNERDI